MRVQTINQSRPLYRPKSARFIQNRDEIERTIQTDPFSVSQKFGIPSPNAQIHLSNYNFLRQKHKRADLWSQFGKFFQNLRAIAFVLPSLVAPSLHWTFSVVLSLHPTNSPAKIAGSRTKRRRHIPNREKASKLRRNWRQR